MIKWDGFRFYFFNLKLTWNSIKVGLDYSRALEYPLVFQRLQLSDLEDKGAKLLDVGSGRFGHFPLYLISRIKNLCVYSADVGDYVFEQYKNVKRLHMEDLIGKRLFIEKADARSLPYPDEYFDRISAISTLEHIPDDGDTVATRELARVLKPGGILVVTVPFNNERYSEVFLPESKVYERERGKEEMLFWARVYHCPALDERIIRPAGLKVLSIDFFGEPVFSYGTLRYVYGEKIPFLRGILRAMSVINPILSMMFFKITNRKNIRHDDWMGAGACITFEK